MFWGLLSLILMNTRQNIKIEEIINHANFFYTKGKYEKLDKLNDYEFLKYLELKYCGYNNNVIPTIGSKDVKYLLQPRHPGGDRMSIFF